MRWTIIWALAVSLFVIPSSATHAQAPPENEYLEFWKSYFQGDWTVEVITGDSEGRIAAGTQATWSCRLAPAGTCMRLTARKGDGGNFHDRDF